MSKCWWCRGQLIWNNDYDASDYYDEGERDGIVTFLHCSECGAQVVYIPPRSDWEEED